MQRYEVITYRGNVIIEADSHVDAAYRWTKQHLDLWKGCKVFVRLEGDDVVITVEVCLPKHLSVI